MIILTVTMMPSFAPLPSLLSKPRSFDSKSPDAVDLHKPSHPQFCREARKLSHRSLPKPPASLLVFPAGVEFTRRRHLQLALCSAHAAPLCP
ncbi:hypothetical protein M0R45_005048 [Rubus argutus]|uniref:Uncharacterized protein n=1 Tax=Rubus argutus TaxID=59490 RepID=A0AAW1YLD1_RUBAR